MLQQPLYQRNVKAAVLVDFRCVPLAKVVGADTLIAKVIAHNGKIGLFYIPFKERIDKKLTSLGKL